MKLLVTGGSGFFGKNFLEQYGDYHLVSAPTHKQLNLVDAASVRSYFSSDYFDVVLHLAGSDKPVNKIDEAENLVMFKNLQREAILKRVQRLIVIGSGSEYDASWHVSNAIEDEIGFHVPEDPHGVIYYLINMLGAKDKITTNLRHFTVYGKYASPYTNIISKLAYYAIRGKDIVFSNDKLISLIYINDSLKVVNAAVNGELPKNDYNTVSGTKYKLSQIARYLKDLTGNNFNIAVNDKYMGIEYTADNTRLKTALPKLKFTSINKGLTELLDYMEGAQDTFNEKRIKL